MAIIDKADYEKLAAGGAVDVLGSFDISVELMPTDLELAKDSESVTSLGLRYMGEYRMSIHRDEIDAICDFLKSFDFEHYANLQSSSKEG